MNALQAAKKKFSSGLPANPANPANVASDIRKIRKIRKSSEADKTSAARARRRNALRAMMSEASETQTHFYLTEDKAYSDYVVVALAIRGVGFCELSIKRERYDPFRLLEIIDGERPVTASH